MFLKKYLVEICCVGINMKIKNFLHHFRLKRAFKLINGKLCGPHFFERKRKLLIKAGFKIGKNTKIVGPIFVSTGLQIGNDCWVGAFFKCTGNGNVFIGDNCDIAPEVSFSTGTHKIGDRKRRASTGITLDCKIGDGCWIGQKTLILAGVNIGNGCVVGASSLINKTINEDNCLIAGVPGKVKKRYDE